jgi:diadenosine tetraphosphate (Ap4A) HIT family hydrolase
MPTAKELQDEGICPMCDGAVNHFRVQLLPRYAGDTTGSKNFVRPREQYVADEESLKSIREKMDFLCFM